MNRPPPVTVKLRTHWSALSLLFLAGFLAAFQFAKIPFMLPGLSAQIAMTQLQQAVLLSIIALVGAIAGAFAGAIMQSSGLRRTLLAGLIIAMAGALLPLWVEDYLLLLLARLIEGVGHMAIVVSVPTLMLPLCKATDRPKVMALWSCYFTTTFVLTALAAPFILNYSDWQGFALLHAGLLILTAWGILRTRSIADPDNDTAREIRAPLAVTLHPHNLLAAQWRLLSQRRLLAIPASFFGYTLLFVTLVSVLPKWVTTTEQAALSFAFILPCASLLGTIIALMALSRQVTGQRLITVVAWSLGLCGLGLMLSDPTDVLTRGVVILVFVLLGLLPAGIISSLPGLFTANDPDIALVNGGLVQFGNLGNFVGAPLLTLMLLSWGWVSFGVYLLLGTAVAGLCLWLLYPGSNEQNTNVAISE